MFPPSSPAGHRTCRGTEPPRPDGAGRPRPRGGRVVSRAWLETLLPFPPRSACSVPACTTSRTSTSRASTSRCRWESSWQSLACPAPARPPLSWRPSSPRCGPWPRTHPCPPRSPRSMPATPAEWSSPPAHPHRFPPTPARPAVPPAATWPPIWPTTLAETGRNAAPPSCSTTELVHGHPHAGADRELCRSARGP